MIIAKRIMDRVKRDATGNVQEDTMTAETLIEIFNTDPRELSTLPVFICAGEIEYAIGTVTHKDQGIALNLLVLPQHLIED